VDHGSALILVDPLDPSSTVIQEAINDPQKEKSEEILCFEVLDVRS
jgi:hypothetical protein